MITQKEIRKLLSYNKKTGILRWNVNKRRVKRGDIAGTHDTNGYIQIRINGVKYLAHRLIWLGVKGYLPEHDIDHDDNIKDNNAWDNLYELTHINNTRNIGNRSNNKSGVNGVTWDKHNNKWRVNITINFNQKSIGRFKYFDEAVYHRLAAEQCLDWFNNECNSPSYKYIKGLTNNAS